MRALGMDPERERDDLAARELRELLARLEDLWPSLAREDAVGAALVVRGLAARPPVPRPSTRSAEPARAAGLAPASGPR
jgi:hypothetical protein